MRTRLVFSLSLPKLKPIENPARITKMNEEYSRIVDKLLSMCNSNLVGMACVGSIARGNNDNLSDYDFVLIWENLNVLPWPEGAFRIKNNKLGIRNVVLSDLEQRRWSQIERHAFTYSKIEYDPENILPQLIKSKCIWYPKERLRLFCDFLFRISYITDHTKNYKNCWNDREELLLSKSRAQKLFSMYLVHQYICWLIKLALVTDRQFIPPEKVYLSPWVKNLSPRAYNIYKKATNKKNALLKPSIPTINKTFAEEVKKMIADFEKEAPLPADISQYRYMNIRRLSND